MCSGFVVYEKHHKWEILGHLKMVAVEDLICCRSIEDLSFNGVKRCSAAWNSNPCPNFITERRLLTTLRWKFVDPGKCRHGVISTLLGDWLISSPLRHLRYWSFCSNAVGVAMCNQRGRQRSNFLLKFRNPA